ncbi:hypothetical protein GIB67_025338 [Kingdonia uniflora]|uniref:CASP-like protein n=1 Tax=Kingdonia uniflora TaxID=39325 RepID=A0A7J7NC09_9MAGN|nr:hypothetical protein GIB67_025338 [Kingdonia uniflora]
MYSQQQQQHSFSSSSPLFFSPSPNISKERVSETTMNGGHKTTPDDVEMTTMTKTEESGGMSGPLVRKHRRKSDIVQLFLRLVCLFSLGIAIAVMTTAEQKGNLQIYGFNLPIYSKWSFANSFEYLVGMAAAAAAHSLLQLIISGTKLLKKSHVVPSRKHAWLVFAGDQVITHFALGI